MPCYSLLQLLFYPNAMRPLRSYPHGWMVAGPPFNRTPEEHTLVLQLDALYAERDDALGEGDLDRLHEVQAAITETAQQISMVRRAAGA
jgi:hypothetical protein